MMRSLILAIASAALLTPAALADGALAPGQPAGVHQAQLTNPNTMMFIGLGVLVIGAGVYLAHGSYKIPGQSSATSTSP
ncbi:MAG TPA: hypothetical protein VH019_00070 [Rhizomicrobium sp.]|jgi:hypothetical protein|nr:hypothetical protein [Rhizomicrobium sp.]